MLNHRIKPGHRRQRERFERGSIVIAVSGLMLLVMIGSTLVIRGHVEIRAVQSEADAVIARAGAEQGVAEVLARLDAGERGDFSDERSTANGVFRYRATELSDTSYRVEAEGEVDGETRAIEVTITGDGSSSTSSYALFIDEYGRISNNIGTISGTVATNGQLDVSGTPPGDSVDLYGPDARCSGCSNTNNVAEALSVPPPVAPTGTTRDCPSNGSFSGIIDGQGGTPYLCNTSHVRRNRVQFTGTVTVINPPLIVYVATGLDIRIRNATVNATGEPDDFQLYGLGDDDYWWYDVWNSKIIGTLYGPGRDSLLQAASIAGPVSMGVVWISSPYGVWIEPTGDLISVEAAGWTVTSFDRVPTG